MKESIIVIVVVAISLGMGIGSLQKGRADEMMPVTIGMDGTAVNSLVHIALDRGLFKNNRLKVNVREYESGKAAVDGMLRGEVEVATAAEFVLVGQAFKKEHIRVLATIDKFEHIYLIGRTDRGIKEIRDLKGRKVGVTLKSASQFYLGRFLDLHGMNMGQIVPVHVSPAQTADALGRGEVDAIVAWQPSIKAIEDRLGGRTVKWGAHLGQAAYCIVVAKGPWIARHPDEVKRLVAALVQAADYHAGHPDKSAAILKRRLRYDDSYLKAIRPEHQHSVSLDQSLITAMEDEARWMIKNGLVPEKQVPDFLDYIYEDGLGVIAPESVNIIR